MPSTPDGRVGLVDRNGPLSEPIAYAQMVGHSGKDAAVVDQNPELGHLERSQRFMKQAHEFQFAQDSSRTDDVGIALHKFLVPAFAGSVSPPDGLHLITLERHGNLVPVHGHKAGKGHSEIIPQRLLADLKAQRFAVSGVQGVVLSLAQKVPVVQDFENQLIAFLAILPRQGRQGLHRRRFDGLKTAPFEGGTKGGENPLTARHHLWGKVTRAFWNAGLAHAESTKLQGHAGFLQREKPQMRMRPSSPAVAKVPLPLHTIALMERV